MSFPNLDAATQAELAQQAERFLKANRVSIVVGLVLAPILFFGLGGFFFAVIPAPFGAWVGGSIAGAGVIFLAFLGGYAWLTSRRRPYLAWSTVQGWHELVGRHGQRSYLVALAIEEARALRDGQMGAPDPATTQDRGRDEQDERAGEARPEQRGDAGFGDRGG